MSTRAIDSSSTYAPTSDESSQIESLSPTTIQYNEAITVTPSGETKEHTFTPLQQTLRLLPFVALGSYALNNQPFDDAVAAVWSTIYSWPASHVGLFEASTAVFGFTWAISFYLALHRVLGPEKTKEYRLDDTVPTDVIDEWTDGKNWFEWFNPGASYLASIWIYQQIFQTYVPPPEAAPTFGVLCTEVVFGVFLYDLAFYPLHYLMHNIPFAPLRRIHGYHHRVSDSALNSVETVQHSYIDGFLQVAVNVAVQHVSPFGGAKHALSRIIHNFVVTYLLAEAHSGYDLPWMAHRVWPEIMGGSVRHDGHHHDGRVYYHQFFKYIDDYFGFTDEGIEKRKAERIAARRKREQML